jgi:hypothetical protein
MNQAEICLNIKLQSQVSHSLHNHFTRFKFQSDQHGKIFKMHNMILRMARFEILLVLKDSDEFVILWPQTAETDVQ